MKKISLKLQKKMIFYALLIFLISLSIGLLIRQDMRFEAERVQANVAELYRIFARDILQDGFASLFDAQARAANTELLSHPPGYALFLAILFYFTGESIFALQFVSICFNALSAVVIFLIARELFFTQSAGLIAGLLAALSPQLAANSILPLPDTLMIFPLLLAIYFLILAYNKPRFWKILASAFSLATGCWLRANILLLPLFFGAAMLILFDRKRALKFVAAFFIVFILTVSPITIRNAIVYHKFIPISLGAGQTLLEGIADYDTQNNFGFPASDVGICRMEAEKFQHPAYATSLFREDGIERDRMRVAQGKEVIINHPFWFAGVMVRRAAWMLKFERTPVISTQLSPASDTEKGHLIWENSPADLFARGTNVSPEVKVSQDANNLIIETDSSKNLAQFASEFIQVTKNVGYSAVIALRLREGRVSIKIKGIESGDIYNLTVIDLEEGSTEQPVKIVQVPFVPSRNEPIQLVIFNEPRTSTKSSLEIKNIQLKSLGDSSLVWLRPFRFLIHYFQKIFIESVMLAFAISGLIILVREKRWSALLILAIVPIYYFCIQSILHTEPRYVMAIHYFLFVPVAVCFTKAKEIIIKSLKKLYRPQEA